MNLTATKQAPIRAREKCGAGIQTQSQNDQPPQNESDLSTCEIVLMVSILAARASMRRSKCRAGAWYGLRLQLRLRLWSSAERSRDNRHNHGLRIVDRYCNQGIAARVAAVHLHCVAFHTQYRSDLFFCFFGRGGGFRGMAIGHGGGEQSSFFHLSFRGGRFP